MKSKETNTPQYTSAYTAVSKNGLFELTRSAQLGQVVLMQALVCEFIKIGLQSITSLTTKASI